MFLHQGIWFPDGEKHIPGWMTSSGQIVDGRGTYQYKKWMACIPFISQWRVAVDIGGHVGTWAMHLAKKFKTVHAFEPVAPFGDCFVRNAPSVILHRCALGAVSGKVRMRVNPEDTGGSHVDPVAENGNVELRTLDSFGFDHVDFIKVDCEGYEIHALSGGVETIRKNRPCIIVEQKQHIMERNFGTAGTPAVDFLKDMGAVVRKEISGDFILSW